MVRISIMGEEKPEEELMGKRKSSPRLSATPLRRLFLFFANLVFFIHRWKKFLKNFPIAILRLIRGCDSMRAFPICDHQTIVTYRLTTKRIR
ncbi:hypothetical protein EDM56_04120 [Brevibacillus fluminis]|uniref:Uncharacterized protein n=1 Tax=Brevibacillus fluminis TaxID=511487 RepID=A0A3M8DV24_9BACL|nr:hypothetical protein EDM56_04120 [Brevibacillus fluminis]